MNARDFAPGDHVDVPDAAGAPRSGVVRHVSEVHVWVDYNAGVTHPFLPEHVTLVERAVTEPEEPIDFDEPARVALRRVAGIAVFLLAAAVVTSQAARAVGWPGLISGALFSVAAWFGYCGITARDVGDETAALEAWRDSATTLALATAAAWVGWVQ